VREIELQVEEAAEGGYQAKALGCSIPTAAATFGEPEAMLQDPVRCHFGPKKKPLLTRLQLGKNDARDR
jgi:hypothetical protein